MREIYRVSVIMRIEKKSESDIRREKEREPLSVCRL